MRQPLTHDEQANIEHNHARATRFTNTHVLAHDSMGAYYILKRTGHPASSCYAPLEVVVGMLSYTAAIEVWRGVYDKTYCDYEDSQREVWQAA